MNNGRKKGLIEWERHKSIFIRYTDRGNPAEHNFCGTVGRAESVYTEGGAGGYSTGNPSRGIEYLPKKQRGMAGEKSSDAYTI